MNPNDINKEELVDWINDEISAKGTSSAFFGHGLDPATGKYSADAIADNLINGRLKITGLELSKFKYEN